jgi:hypothetical protein
MMVEDDTEVEDTTVAAVEPQAEQPPPVVPTTTPSATPSATISPPATTASPPPAATPNPFGITGAAAAVLANISNTANNGASGSTSGSSNSSPTTSSVAALFNGTLPSQTESDPFAAMQPLGTTSSQQQHQHQHQQAPSKPLQTQPSSLGAAPFVPTGVATVFSEPTRTSSQPQQQQQPTTTESTSIPPSPSPYTHSAPLVSIPSASTPQPPAAAASSSDGHGHSHSQDGHGHSHSHSHSHDQHDDHDHDHGHGHGHQQQATYAPPSIYDNVSHSSGPYSRKQQQQQQQQYGVYNTNASYSSSPSSSFGLFDQWNEPAPTGSLINLPLKRMLHRMNATLLVHYLIRVQSVGAIPQLYRLAISDREGKAKSVILVVRLLYTLLALIFASLSGSLGLNAIALHMVFDSIYLIINLIAHVLNKHEGPSKAFSFGYDLKTQPTESCRCCANK